MKKYTVFGIEITIEVKSKYEEEPNDYCYFYDVIMQNNCGEQIRYSDVCWFEDEEKNEDDVINCFLSRTYPLLEPMDEYGYVFNSNVFNKFVGEDWLDQHYTIYRLGG